MYKEYINAAGSFISKTYEKSGFSITVNSPSLSQAQRTNTDIQIKDQITKILRQQNKS